MEIQGNIQVADTEDTLMQGVDLVTYPIALLRGGLGVSYQSCKPKGGTSLSEDSIEQLQADMLREVPEAVQEACNQKAEEFLRACVRYAKTMQTSEDPWMGIRCLTESLVYIKDAHQRMNKELAVRRKPTRTIDSFVR